MATSTGFFVQDIPSVNASELGPTIIFAPHPDDEALGCAGLLALLTRESIPVHVVIMTDGIGSHRNSRQFPSERLREIRKQEAIDSLEALGLQRSAISFLDLPDQFLPDSETSGFDDAVDAVHWALKNRFKPETLVVPWRRDRHCDHEATWQIVSAAAERIKFKGRWLEYSVWADELGGPDAHPRDDEVRRLRLDIEDVLELKRRAIHCHRSQTTDLISDDPTGFRLSPGTISRFDIPWETYLEPVRGR
jgi:LmbE family N-acetylglucosaminyl deacetylase